MGHRSFLRLATTALLLANSALCRAEDQEVSFDISPDGRSIIFSSSTRTGTDLYLLDLKSRQVTQLTNSKQQDEWAPAFSPSGKLLAYAGSSKNGTSIFIRTLDGKSARQLTKNHNVSDIGPSFSPDGRFIAFSRAHTYRPYSMGGFVWDDADVYIVSVDGKHLRRVTRRKHYMGVGVEYSPTGRELLLSGSVEGYVNDIFIVSSHGRKAPRNLTQSKKDGPGSSNASFSPDGKRIVFVSDRAERCAYGLWLMSANGRNARLIYTPGYVESPLFTPDGKRLLFLKVLGPTDIKYELWQVNVDGKNPRRIVDSTFFGDPLKWKHRP